MNPPPQRLLQCALCDYHQTGNPDHPPRCPQHPDRALVAQSYLKNGPKDYLLGSRLGGKYLINRPLGRGQFGKVYHALQEGAGEILRPVAIKVLREDRTDMQALFLDEMKVVAQLTSRHIVRYLDSGFDQKHRLSYMVMELVKGDTLSKMINESITMSSDRASQLIAQLLIALDLAHSEGVIHRDLKPSNLMVCKQDGEDVLKVLDFGVARPNASQPREQTQGVIPGTPAYMAFELFCGYTGEVSANMDLFSVGVIYYQLIMGHMPFEVEGEIDHLISYYKLYSGNPKPTLIGANAPKRVADVIFKALHLDPKRRYQSAQDMLKAIAPWSPYAARHLLMVGDMSGGYNGYLPSMRYTSEHRSKSSRWVWLAIAALLGGTLGLGVHLSRTQIVSPQEEVEVVRSETGKVNGGVYTQVKVTPLGE
jgi:serine/threonine protein kinase